MHGVSNHASQNTKTVLVCSRTNDVRVLQARLVRNGCSLAHCAGPKHGMFWADFTIMASLPPQSCSAKRSGEPREQPKIPRVMPLSPMRTAHSG